MVGNQWYKNAFGFSKFTNSKLYQMINNEAVMRIAQKIKNTRVQKGFTIQQISERSNISKGLLSKIENSRTIPSLPVFVGLINSLGLSLKDFFEDMVLTNGRDYVLIKQKEYKKIEKENRKGFSYEQVFLQGLASCTFEIVILTINAGTAGTATTTDGFEFKYVLSGSCEYYINDEVIFIEKGDSIYFDASKPHWPVNKTNENVVMLVIYFLIPK